jgi:DNA polymerase-3 subunit alpha
VDKELLREFNEGIICTSTCLGGEIPQALMKQNNAAAKELAETYLDIFGPDRFFIELQDHGLDEQRGVNPELRELARRLGVGLIATNDVHYLDPTDVEAHDILCCISTGKLVSDEDRFKFPCGEFYLKTPTEMGKLFADCPEALSNTLRVAEMCNVEFNFGKRYAPVYRLEAPLTPDIRLRELVYEGAERKYGGITDELRERIDYELGVISSKGFSSYFLIVWDFMNYARGRSIPCSARGSGCSSVVSYCLNISEPDPLIYDLYFERFMDPDRDEMPDIDVDICQEGRAEVINYVRQKYGHVAQIITFGTLKPKAAVKDVARVLGLPFDEATRLTDLIPNDLKITIDKALAAEPELRRRCESEPLIRKIIEVSRKLEGLSRHAGVHAAGVVVADQPLDTLLPLYKASGDDSVITQFDGPTVEAVGLLKLDFLGLRTLTTLQRAIDLVKQHRGVTIDREKLDLTDQRVYQLFVRGHTAGVFQFESGGMRDVVMRMRPNRIQDLIAANALYRPGPMKYIDDYVARKHGQSWTTPHKIMTEVLQETYGIMVYQEQVSRLVNRLGGLELKRAFRLAKLISKKKTDQIAKQRPEFIEGCVKRGLEASTAEKIFEDILEFGGYAFNKAHSTGYALVAFHTAYLKAYYPVEFMAALITFESGSTDKVHEYIDECRRMGIDVAPPDINASDRDFTPDTRADDKPVIRFGLSAIKGIGDRTVEAIIAARKSGPFKSIFDFCERVESTCLNSKVIEALICCGAFDSTGAMRKALMDVAEDALKSGQRSQEDKRSGQFNLFGDMAAPAPTKAIATGAQWSEAEMLAREKAVLGFYVTRHPLTYWGRLLEACTTAATTELRSFLDRSPVVVGGLVTGLRNVQLKTGRNAGEKMLVITLEDLKGKVEVTLWPPELEKYRALVKQDAVIFVRGTVSRMREEPSVRAIDVLPASEAAVGLASGLLLRLDEVTGSPDLPEKIIALAGKHRGSLPLYIEIETTDGNLVTIQVNGDLKVACTAEALRDFTALLGGAERVVCPGPTKRPIPWELVSPAA